MMLIALFMISICVVLIGAGGLIYNQEGYDVFFAGILGMVISYLGLGG